MGWAWRRRATAEIEETPDWRTAGPYQLIVMGLAWIGWLVFNLYREVVDRVYLPFERGDHHRLFEWVAQAEDPKHFRSAIVSQCFWLAVTGLLVVQGARALAREGKRSRAQAAPPIPGPPPPDPRAVVIEPPTNEPIVR